jgi:hypothetical protein
MHDTDLSFSRPLTAGHQPMTTCRKWQLVALSTTATFDDFPALLLLPQKEPKVLSPLSDVGDQVERETCV